MSMERHRCKLCSKVFSNGRALGGHMRSHLATLPLPPKKKLTVLPLPPTSTDHQQLTDQSDSSSTHSGYGLRENPKRSIKASDPEFLDAGSVVDERESDTDDQSTRKRVKKSKSRAPPSTTVESPPVSSVSDPASHHQSDEEVALCLMMLSRDVWVRKLAVSVQCEEKSVNNQKSKFKCLGCKKMFKTNRSLAAHKASCKHYCLQVKQSKNNSILLAAGEEQKIYECPFCYRVFGSGQALGGHKRSHLLGSSPTTNVVTNIVVVASSNNAHDDHDDDKVGDSATTSFVLDLNLPAPVEDF